MRGGRGGGKGCRGGLVLGVMGKTTFADGLHIAVLSQQGRGGFRELWSVLIDRVRGIWNREEDRLTRLKKISF